MEIDNGLVKGLGITGLVAGILTFVVSFIPCFGIYSIYIGSFGLAASIVAFILARKQNLEKGLIIAALILSLIGVGVAYRQYIAIKESLEVFKDSMQELNDAINEIE